MIGWLTLIAAAVQTPPTLGPGVIGAPGGTGTGPAVAEVRADLLGHTLYHPLRPPAAPMPIVLWGNGGCRDNGLAYADFLREVASHGYLVVAVGRARREEPIRPAPPPSVAPVPAAGAPGTPPPTRAPDETQAAQLIEGLDWALRENGRRGSSFYRHLDTHAVAVMGHSCGGLQAIATAADRRVRTAIIFDSGVYNRGPDAGRSGIAIGKDALRQIHGPIAYVNGGPADIAYANARDDWERIGHVPALFAWQPVGHGGTFFTAPNGGAFARLAVDWLDWQLKRRIAAGRMFSGTASGLCRDPAWHVERKRL